MFGPTLKRSATVTGALVLSGAIVMTTATTASAAPQPPRQASAQAAQLSLLGTPLNTPSVTAQRASGPRVTKTAEGPAVLGQQDLVKVGVVSAKAIAGTQRSFSCSGVLAEGGTLTVGGNGLDCAAVSPGAGGVVVDLGSITSALPIGIGTIRLAFSSITANALYEGTTTSGIARVNNLQLQVCVGAQLGGSCVGQLVKVPMVLKGTANENVVAAILASITRTPQLATVLAPLTSALNRLVTIRTNVQTHPTDGSIKVVGLQLKVLGTTRVANLAIASAGPYAP